jgi:hypothetical protein
MTNAEILNPWDLISHNASHVLIQLQGIDRSNELLTKVLIQYFVLHEMHSHYVKILHNTGSEVFCVMLDLKSANW